MSRQIYTERKGVDMRIGEYMCLCGNGCETIVYRKWTFKPSIRAICWACFWVDARDLGYTLQILVDVAPDDLSEYEPA